MAVNWKSALNWKKPCFVCGSLDHGARQCSKNCFICKKCGHHVKDCPDKYKSSSNPGNICLRCGVSGYDMFSCRNDYSQDDIKVSSCSLVFLIIVFSIAVALSSVMVFVLLTVLLMFFLPNQEIQCYICKSFGHICCINFVDTSPREVSCYRCGQLGHTGLVSFTRYAHILLLELIGHIGSVAGKVVLCQ
ncbi:cellular nucleic acid-binding protein homolog isoform X1 [Gossypium hirsutum]|uniref:Cellular nucleic acid-binding protein homolog isoform X1 n=1 Tax=Gossypium hirsutum TaxID=3635 RepID=A0ABM3BCQ4_GOSHI|nr:cellular nucleic acid-binding protein homolog isoform X1 [Gossypium hirsutum]XP_040964829.1 cellular nucleic acid-binding protein homolog isoform X1 [Gossypium hirsutum]